MERQHRLFDGSEGESGEVFRRLQKEVQARVRKLLADLAIGRVKVRQKEARDER